MIVVTILILTAAGFYHNLQTKKGGVVPDGFHTAKKQKPLQGMFLTTINQVCVFRLILQFSSNASIGSMFNITTDVSYIIYFYTAALAL